MDDFRGTPMTQETSIYDCNIANPSLKSGVTPIFRQSHTTLDYHVQYWRSIWILLMGIIFRAKKIIIPFLRIWKAMGKTSPTSHSTGESKRVPKKENGETNIYIYFFIDIYMYIYIYIYSNRRWILPLPFRVSSSSWGVAAPYRYGKSHRSKWMIMENVHITLERSTSLAKPTISMAMASI